MRVTHLSLHDFRNYEQAEVGFTPGLNLIIGRNGQGKTNLVEAIAYFASLSSHRVNGDVALIRSGANAGVARMVVRARDRDALLEIQLNRGSANRAQVNRNGVRSRELPRWFSTVVFAPEDLSIVRGDPNRRRAFLDEALVAKQPAMIAVLADYERVVRQRTSLLKSARASGSRTSLDSTLNIWDDQLIELGARIMCERRVLLRELSGPVSAAYARLVGEDHAPHLGMSESVTTTLANVSRETSNRAEFLEAKESYDSSESSIGRFDPLVSRETLATEFRSALLHLRTQEYERAATLVGPHRDDLDLQLNGLPVKGYASHGESWSFVLSLRLSLAELLRQNSVTGDPVIILDDVFAELDSRRRARLLQAVEGYEQVIVTAAVGEDVPDVPSWNRIRIQSGRVLPDEELG